MSKKVKALVERDIKSRLGDIDGVAVISPVGLDGLKNNRLRGKLRAQGLRMTVVQNNLARRATAGGKLAGFEALFDGPTAVIYGKGVAAPNIARLLVAEKKDNEKLNLKGVFFEGELYHGEEGVKQASKLPTREEAIASVVASILGPGRKLGGAIKAPASIAAALVVAAGEKAKEKEGAAPAAA